MSVIAAVPLFAVSLAVTLLAARLFARRLDRLGVRFGLSEALIGLLAALAADGPEISAALFALIKGAVRLSRAVLLLDGAIGAAVMLIAAAILLGWLPAAAGAILASAILGPYLLLVIGGTQGLVPRLREGSSIARIATALAQRPPREPLPAAANPTHHLLGLIVLDVALIVAGSAGMVQAALTLGDHWHVSRPLLGMLILAPLTSVPNAITGVRLGLAGRSAALVGEAFNSNTINLAGGVIAPALFTTVIATTTTAKIQLAWLIGMTFACVAMLARRGGMRRPGAAALIVMYGGFAALQAT
jgi:Ca2+/Na+ antiporter